MQDPLKLRTEKELAETRLEEAIVIIDLYLNASNKSERKRISFYAKKAYKEYYGTDYLNRNER